MDEEFVRGSGTDACECACHKEGEFLKLGPFGKYFACCACGGRDEAAARTARWITAPSRLLHKIDQL